MRKKLVLSAITITFADRYTWGQYLAAETATDTVHQLILSVRLGMIRTGSFQPSLSYSKSQRPCRLLAFDTSTFIGAKR